MRSAIVGRLPAQEVDEGRVGELYSIVPGDKVQMNVRVGVVLLLLQSPCGEQRLNFAIEILPAVSFTIGKDHVIDYRCPLLREAVIGLLGSEYLTD